MTNLLNTRVALGGAELMARGERVGPANLCGRSQGVCVYLEAETAASHLLAFLFLLLLLLLLLCLPLLPKQRRHYASLSFFVRNLAYITDLTILFSFLSLSSLPSLPPSSLFPFYILRCICLLSRHSCLRCTREG